MMSWREAETFPTTAPLMMTSRANRRLNARRFAHGYGALADDFAAEFAVDAKALAQAQRACELGTLEDEGVVTVPRALAPVRLSGRLGAQRLSRRRRRIDARICTKAGTSITSMPSRPQEGGGSWWLKRGAQCSVLSAGVRHSGSSGWSK